MKQGFIKIHRQIFEWEWYDSTNVKIVFLHILLKANYTDKNWRGIEIKRGSFLTSVEKLRNELGLPVQKIRTALRKLEKTKEITIKSTSHLTIVTINNYDEYQLAALSDQQAINKQTTIIQQSNNMPLTNDQQTVNKQLTITKKEKNNKNIKKDKKTKEETFLDSKDISEILFKKILEFIKYREEVGKPYKSQKSIEALVKKLQKEKEEIAIKQIDQSIVNGWLGVFKLNSESKNHKGRNNIYEPKESKRTELSRLKL